MCPEERRTTLFTRLLSRQGSRQATPSLTTWTATSRKVLAGWTWRSIKVKGTKHLRHPWWWSNTDNLIALIVVYNSNYIRLWAVEVLWTDDTKSKRITLCKWFQCRFCCVIFAGKRWSTASAYLRPALGRPNLKAEVRCLTTKILFDGRRAVGVEYVQNGHKKRVKIINEQNFNYRK